MKKVKYFSFFYSVKKQTLPKSIFKKKLLIKINKIIKYMKNLLIIIMVTPFEPHSLPNY